METPRLNEPALRRGGIFLSGLTHGGRPLRDLSGRERAHRRLAFRGRQRALPKDHGRQPSDPQSDRGMYRADPALLVDISARLSRLVQPLRSEPAWIVASPA